MSKRTKVILLIACFLILIFGVGLMLYPAISVNYAKAHHSDVFMEYKTEVEQIDTTKIDQVWAEAQEYNRKLFNKEINILDPKTNGYYDQLDMLHNGVMGYVTIPAINVTLPIFHGTSDKVLKAGAGHMPESSLPVGGDSTHCVITAHSGVASDPMFSDLGLLEIGDIFQLNILGQILTYEVYDLPDPVLPQYVDVIQVQEGKDLCTLITCTPFGVNTHRLLIHAKRIPNPVEDIEVVSTEASKELSENSIWESNYKKSLRLGVTIVASIIFLILLFSLFRYILTPSKPGKYERKKRNEKRK